MTNTTVVKTDTRCELFRAVAALRVAAGPNPHPSAAIRDSRTIQSTPESGSRAGYDGHKRRNGSNVHATVDRLGHMLALRVTAASAQDRDPVFELAAEVQAVTGSRSGSGLSTRGYTGYQPAADARAHGIDLVVMTHTEPKRGFVLLPRQ